MELMELMKDLHPLGVTWSSKRLDNIHIHLFMPERFGLQAAHRSEWHHLGSLGVQSALITYTSISLCLSALDFKQRIGASDSPFGGLVEVQAARKLAAIYSIIVAA